MKKTVKGKNIIGKQKGKRKKFKRALIIFNIFISDAGQNRDFLFNSGIN